METQVQNKTTTKLDAIRKVIFNGDLSQLSPELKDQYYMSVCETLGLNYLTKPFDFIKFQGKEVMYANKGCAEQLRMVHKIGLKVLSKERIDDLLIVTVEASDKEGRIDSASGVIFVGNLKGEAMANALMKAETKAKRRATFSICGLNFLDEDEIENQPKEIKSVVEVVSQNTDQDLKQIVQQNKSEIEKNEISKEQNVDSDELIIEFGKYKGMKISSIPESDLIEYAAYLESASAEAGKPLNEKGQAFVNAVAELIKPAIKK